MEPDQEMLDFFAKQGPVRFASNDVPPVRETPQERAAFLRSFLKEPEHRCHAKNVRAIIHLYETGKIKWGDVVYAQHGKIFYEEPEPSFGSAIWVEVS